jgi:hypothetical protein
LHRNRDHRALRQLQLADLQQRDTRNVGKARPPHAATAPKIASAMRIRRDLLTSRSRLPAKDQSRTKMISRLVNSLSARHELEQKRKLPRSPHFARFSRAVRADLVCNSGTS